MTKLSRRSFLSSVAASAVAASAFGLSGPAFAQAGGKMTIISHRVHQLTATEGQGGDVTADWQAANNTSLEWVTLDLDAIHDRLFREASLAQTNIGLGFVLNSRAVPSALELFEPLDAFLEADPIEDFGDFSQGYVTAFKSDGKLMGVPYRHAANALHWNTELFAERGVDGPPKTIEDFLDVARKLSYTRDDGTRVYAFSFEGNNYSTLVMLARAFGGDFITEDYQLKTDSDGMLKALQLLQTMYKEELMPTNLTSMTQNDLISSMQQGQVAMMVFPFGRTVLFNDPAASKHPGAFKTALFPGNAEMTARGEVISSAEFWAMAIPRNAANKELSWSLIKTLSSKEATIREAMNGNGPVRVSAYSDSRLAEAVPYAAQEAIALKWSRVPLPAFDESAKAKDIAVEELQGAILGFQTPEEAQANLTKRLQPLLPT